MHSHDPDLRGQAFRPSEYRRHIGDQSGSGFGSSGGSGSHGELPRRGGGRRGAAKYPPQGGRSIGGDPWYHYGRSYPVEANRQTILLAQIEHIDAANAVGEILSVDGVDGCFVGPTDLALSMGLSHVGFETDDRHRAAIQRTVDVCLSLGKIAASNCYNLADAGEKLAQGYNWITFRSDMDLFLSSAQSLLNDLRQVTAASMEAAAR